ncbi:MAG: hypothetical protein JNN30_14680 [Rhodanobacteraceae bacterium]|nr:hypothetical protein [Rhodanobacteraceae bacterium]
MSNRHDVVLSVGAVLISAVSLGVAVSSNRTQERLLAASTWPYVQYGTGNRDANGDDVINFSIANAGVGPARIQTFQLLYQGEPQANAGALLSHCCDGKGKNLATVTSSVEGVLKVGESGSFLVFAAKKIRRKCGNASMRSASK